MRHKRLRWFLILVLLFGGAYWGYQLVNKKDQPNPMSKPERPIPVLTQPVEQKDVSLWLDALGTVTPQHQVTIKSRIDGQLLSTHFQEGQWVEPGQLLAQIDPKPLETQLAQLNAQKQRNQALLTNAQLDLKRYEQLSQDDAISGQQKDTQASLVKQYQATLTADEANINNLKLQLNYTQITAPIAGKVGFRLVDPGNQVKANDGTGITNITQLNPIYVTFSIPEHYLPDIQKQLKPEVSERKSADAMVIEAWDKERKIKLAISHKLIINNQIDSDTGSIKIKALFDNPDLRLYPNQFVNIRMQRAQMQAAINLPKNAHQIGAQGDYVFAVQSDNRVQIVPIRLFDQTENSLIIAHNEALTPGTPVVVEGTDKLKNKTLVKIIDTKYKPDKQTENP